MEKVLIIIGLIFLGGCASQQLGTASTTKVGNTRTKEVQFLDDNTYLLTEIADDKSYGYTKSNPVKVGGANENSGPRNERRFLNGLLGPNGEEITYFRAGSCCHFKTPNGTFGDSGMLDNYLVSWVGSQDTLNIYINMYDKGDLKIPLGLTGKK
ncbi:MAG: hypothetical protein RH948_12550 [Cyclobacteriaceae bacterium]